MGLPIIALSPKLLVDGGTEEQDLSLGLVHRFIALEFHATYDLDAAGTLHEDGWGAWIEKIELLPAGVDTPFEVPGYESIQLASKAQGGEILTNSIGIATGANQARLVLPVYSMLRDAANPFNAVFDPRGLASYRLRIRLRKLDDVITGADVTNVQCTVTPVEYSIDGLSPVAGKGLEKRERILTETWNGIATRTVNLKRGGAIRSILLVSRDGSGLAGLRSDDIIDNVSLIRNTADRRCDRVPWHTLKESGVFARDYQSPVGVGYIDFDLEGSMAADALVQSTGQNLSSLDLEIRTKATGHLSIVPQYMVRRG